MRLATLLWTAAAGMAAAASNPSGAEIVNLDEAQWSYEKGSSDGSAGVLLHSDERTGGIDLLVRQPAGNVIAPHYHDSNERIIVVEGQLTLHLESGDKFIKAGGFAFLPAREVQRLSCGAASRCTFYLSWDGKPASHKVE